MKIAIIGAGIGGLSIAIALLLKGHDVAVFERAPALQPIGAGVQISPNGHHVLRALGVLPYIESRAFHPEAIEMRFGVTGQTIFSLPIQSISRQRWHAPYINIHRAALADGLLQRLKALSPSALHLGHELTHYDNNANGTVAAHFSNHHSALFDVLIGADGVHSSVRAQMHGAEAARFTGNIAWRALVPRKALSTPPPPSASIWVGYKRHAVTTYVDAGETVNFVGIVEQEGWEQDGWNIQGDKSEAKSCFAGWHASITGVLEHANTLHKWALLDRAPLPFWSDGRVVLLGDAAHPMLPSMAQGAVQSMEDAYILASFLTQYNAQTAFEHFFKTRIERVTKIQAGSGANSALFHRADTWRQWPTYGPMMLAGAMMPNLIHRRQDWVYGHDVTAL